MMQQHPHLHQTSAPANLTLFTQTAGEYRYILTSGGHSTGNRTINGQEQKLGLNLGVEDVSPAFINTNYRYC